MKTTLILKDELVRKAKSRAALQGWTLSRYMEFCLEKSLRESEFSQVGDLLGQLPPTPPTARTEVDALIHEAGFDRIDPEMWA